MRYRNPDIPEGINVTKRHPLKELLLLLGGALLLVVALSWAFAEFGGGLARLVPFEYEQALAPDALLDSDAGAELDAYLVQLSERLQKQMEIPEDIAIKINFSGDDVFNAFATLGGNVLLYRGLVEQLPHENALAMLLAHEIAHVAHRDPIVGLGRGVGIQIALSTMLGNPDLSVLGSAGLSTQRSFNRDMERAADAAALAAVHGLYGHVGGAEELFEVIKAERDRVGDGELPAMFSSHPLDQQRLEAIEKAARENAWSRSGVITPLPAAFTDWMRVAATKPENGEGTEKHVD